MSGEYLGDFVGDETMVVVFDTFDSNGGSVTLTGLAVTDIEIYKGASITQRASDAGYTLIDTDGIDIDSATGIHGFTVDLSDNTDAGFYATSNDYYIIVNAVTVDSQTVRFVAARFSIQNRYMRGTDSAALASDWTSARAGYVDNINGHTAQTGDNYARLGAPAGASVSADIAAVEGQTDDIGVAGAGLSAVPWNAAWDTEVQSEVNDALVALGLDHLVSAAVTGTDVTDDSIIAFLVSKSATADWDSYDNTADSMEAVGDKVVTVDTVVDGIQTDLSNGTDGLGALKTAIQAVMTTQMTESYAADGVAPTPTQALFLIQQALTEFAIAGTTITIKKLDGSTTAATLTTSDADNPVSATRAT